MQNGKKKKKKKNAKQKSKNVHTKQWYYSMLLAFINPHNPIPIINFNCNPEMKPEVHEGHSVEIKDLKRDVRPGASDAQY